MQGHVKIFCLGEKFTTHTWYQCFQSGEQRSEQAKCRFFVWRHISMQPLKMHNKKWGGLQRGQRVCLVQKMTAPPVGGHDKNKGLSQQGFDTFSLAFGAENIQVRMKGLKRPGSRVVAGLRRCWGDWNVEDAIPSSSVAALDSLGSSIRTASAKGTFPMSGSRCRRPPDVLE